MKEISCFFLRKKRRFEKMEVFFIKRDKQGSVSVLGNPPPKIMKKKSV